MSIGTPNECMTFEHAFNPQVIQATPVTGTALVTPWNRARFVSLAIGGGTLGATDDLTVKWQARRKGTSTWDDIQDNTGAADLAVTQGDTEEIEGGVLMASLDLERLSTGSGKNLPPVSSVQYEYDAVRCNAVNANGSSTAVFFGVYVLSEFNRKPAKRADGTEMTDQTLDNQLPYDFSTTTP